MFVFVRNTYVVRYFHPEGGREYIDDIVHMCLIAGVVENSGMRITLKIQGRLHPFSPRI